MVKTSLDKNVLYVCYDKITVMPLGWDFRDACWIYIFRKTRKGICMTRIRVGQYRQVNYVECKKLPKCPYDRICDNVVLNTSRYVRKEDELLWLSSRRLMNVISLMSLFVYMTVLVYVFQCYVIDRIICLINVHEYLDDAYHALDNQLDNLPSVTCTREPC